MLDKNLNRFIKHSENLRAAYGSAGNKPYSDHAFLSDASKQMVVVRLQDFWGRFVRQLLVLSASGRASDLGGKAVSSGHGFSSTGEVESWLSAQWKGTREPDWHVALTSTAYAKKLKVSNLSNLTAALGSTTSPETDIRTYRNFVVHRNVDTAAKLESLLRTRGWKPPVVARLPDEYVVGGKRIFDAWVDDLQTVARVASK